MQWSLCLCVRTFTTPACVHAIESSHGGSHPAMSPNADASCKKTSKTVGKVLVHLKKPRWCLSQGFRFPSRRANRDADNKGCDRDDSDAESFVSANSSELRSVSSDDNSEVLSFRLTPLIFPIGSISHPHPASPVKIIKKLPFGYVIGRREDATGSQPPSPLTLARNVKKMPALRLIKSRSEIVKKKVVHAVKGTLRRGSWPRPRSRGHEEVEGQEDDEQEEEEEIEEEDGAGCRDDEDVFWKKDVKGLRCRRVQDEDTLS